MKTFVATRNFLIAGAVLALAACASVPQPPLDALQAADIAVTNAEKDNGAEFAPLEMRSAHEKLADAHASALKTDEQSMTKSRQLADEARSDADLASSKARLAKADAVNQEMQKSGKALRQETKRSSGG
jgi:uncharacterized membrane protein YdfJ with MMPL/SSD domain